jgi:kinesin family protein 2/24
VKSLSKVNSSKRDPLSSSVNLRDSNALPLSSALSAESSFEDNTTYVPHDKNRFGWSKQIEREPSPPFNVDRVPSGRMEGSLPPGVYSDYYKGQRGGQNDMTENYFDYSQQTYEHEKPPRVNNKKIETYHKSIFDDKRKIDTQMKWRDMSDFEANISGPDDDLNALIKVTTL